MKRYLGLGLFILVTLAIPTFVYFDSLPRTAIGAGAGDAIPMSIYVSSSVATGWTTIGGDNLGTIKLAGRYGYLSLQVLNTTDGNDATISGFRIQHRPWGGSWNTRYSDADWADSSLFTPDDFPGFDGDEDGNSNGHYVYQLAAGEYCPLDFYVGPWDAIRFQAKVDANTATISVRGRAK